jgi:hypothetical protein
MLFMNVIFSCFFFTAGELSEFSVPLELSQYAVKADPARKPLLVSLLIAKLNLKSVLGTYLFFPFILGSRYRSEFALPNST